MADASSEKERDRLKDDGLVAPRTSVAAAGPGMRELPTIPLAGFRIAGGHTDVGPSQQSIPEKVSGVGSPPTAQQEAGSVRSPTASKRGARAQRPLFRLMVSFFVSAVFRPFLLGSSYFFGAPESRCTCPCIYSARLSKGMRNKVIH